MVQHDSKDPRIAAVLKIPNSTGNIVGCIECHLLPGCDNEDFFRIALPDRRRKTTAHHISKHIVKYHIRLPGLKKLQILQKLKRCDNSSSRTAKSRCGTSGLNTENAAKTLFRYIFQFLRFLIFFPHIIHHRPERFSTKKIDGGIRFWIAPDLDHSFSHGRKRRRQVGSHCRLSDTALSIYCYLQHKILPY